MGSVNDYILYASMIANRGTFNGVTVLKEETVDLQLTERLDISSFQQADTKRGFGLGFGIVYEEDNSTVDYVFWEDPITLVFSLIQRIESLAFK